MNIDQLENDIIRALEGELTESEQKLLMTKIESNESLMNMWADYKMLYEDLDAVPYEEPSVVVKENFHSWLDKQSNEETQIIDFGTKKVQKSSITLWRKWGSIAAILICVFGLWTIFEHNKNVENTLADVSMQLETLMKEQSSTARIKAIRINYNSNTVSVDQEMIQLLIGVLNKDKSSNVRLAAVETLSNYMNQDAVREALIKRLSEESDIGVKLSIITNLGQQQDENLKSTLENIVNDDSQEKFIIDEAHMQLIRFEKMDI